MAIDFGGDSVAQTITQEEKVASEIYMEIKVQTKHSSGSYEWDSILLFYQDDVCDTNSEFYKNNPYYHENIRKQNPCVFVNEYGLIIRGHSENPKGILTSKEYFYAKGSYEYYSIKYVKK